MDSDWASLPHHLLDSVVEKMETLVDYVRFSGVCASWNSVSKSNQSRSFKMNHQLPMLLIPSESEENHNLHSVYNPMSDDISKSKLVVPFYKRFAGSSHGWLVAVEKGCSMTLYKPYCMVEGEERNTHTAIRLPPVFVNPGDVEEHTSVVESHVFKAMITADPLTNPDQCMVMVILSNLKLAFIRPAKDTTWTSINSEQLGGAEEILYCNDQFYVLTCGGKLMSFRITESSISDVKLVANNRSEFTGKSYLVETRNNKFLHVWRDMQWTYASELDDAVAEGDLTIVKRETTRVMVYELDVDEGKWFEIESLGELALFLGDNSSISVLASNFPGCKPNCIYFTHDEDDLISWDDAITDIGVYNLEYKQMELHFGGTTFGLKKGLPIWIVPTLRR